MLTPAEVNELKTIEAMAKTLLEKASAFRKKAAPEETGIKKRRPTQKELDKQRFDNFWAKHKARVAKYIK